MDLTDYPLIHERQDTQFFADLFNDMSLQGQPTPLAVYNLIVTHRDLKLYCSSSGSIIPHRGWRVSDVKRYFSLKGTGKKLLERFEALKDQTMKMIEDARGEV